MIHRPTIGAISEGTLRTVDLLGNFAWELRHISDTPEHIALTIEAEAREAALLGSGHDGTEADADLVNALQDALSECALPGMYFGTAEGDGACFGFWPDWAVLDDMPHLSDLAQADDCEDCDDGFVVVSDHGNVTVYDGSGDELWGAV